MRCLRRQAGWHKYDETVINGDHIQFYRHFKQFGGLKILDDKTLKPVDRFLCFSEVSKVSPTYIRQKNNGLMDQNGKKSKNTPHKHRLRQT